MAQAHGNILAAALSKQGRVVVEDGRKRNAADQGFCVEAENGARYAIRSDDALVFIEGQQEGGKSFIERQSSDNPGVTEGLAKESFFDGARGSDGRGQSQLLRAIGTFAGDG